MIGFVFDYWEKSGYMFLFMKKLLLSALFGVAIVIPTSANAQEYQGCFLINGDNRVVDLNYMCPEPITVEQASATRTASELTPEQVAEGMSAAAILYADTFCEARAQDLTRRQSENAASRVVSAYMVSNALPVDGITQEWLAQAETSSRLLCPELQPTGRYD